MAIIIPAGFEDFENTPDPSHRIVSPHVIDALVPEGLQTLLHAPFGTYKTMLLIYMGLCVALGKKEFLGLAINKSGPFIFADSEDQKRENTRRIILLAEWLGHSGGWPSGFIYHSINVGDLNKDAGVDRIADLASRIGGIALVGVDSFLQASGLDHYGAGTDSKINAFYGRLRKLGTMVMADHETDQPAGATGGNARPAGSSVKRIPTRSVIGLRKVSGAIELRQYKGVNGLLPAFKFTVDFSDDLTEIGIRRVGASSAPVYSGAKATAEHWIVAAIRDRGGEPMSVGEIKAATGKSRTTVYRNVKRLREQGILTPTGELLGIIDKSNSGRDSQNPVPFLCVGGGTGGIVGLADKSGQKKETRVATESEIANEDNLRLEHLRFTQIGEMFDAFMGQLCPGAGDVHVAMARWDLRRIARGTAAIHAADATGLKRLNDECKQAFTQVESTWFGK